LYIKHKIHQQGEIKIIEFYLSSPMEVEGTQHHFTRNGRLVANKQLVYKIDRDEGTDQVRATSIF